MRVRHRIPSIFSLSMVDVLCCALGCVILLWLLNARQHEESTQEQARANNSLLEEAKAEQQRGRALLTAARAERDRKAAAVTAARAERDRLAKELAAAREERDRKATDLLAATSARDAAQARLADLDDRIKGLEGERASLGKDLAAQKKRMSDLQARLKVSAARIAVLETEVKVGSAQVAVEKARADKLGGQLANAEERLRGLNKDLDTARAGRRTQQAQVKKLEDEVSRRGKQLTELEGKLADLKAARDTLSGTVAARDKELAAARAFKEKWAAADEKARGLETQVRQRQDALAESNRTVELLRNQQKRTEKAAENRFAGITLTGKRVIFLVDISGSMEMLDEETAAPEKWAEVRATVARLMRSLPGLEKFQVITFAKSASFPLGSAGEWIDHDSTASADVVLRALNRIKPKDGTNMFAALEAAFRYRAQGLDTIYLLSDGLPNLGPGLKTSARKLTEVQRGTILGKHVRDTLRTKWNSARSSQPRVRINTIGFFYESPDLGAFLWALARENDGSFVGMSKP
jgi:predicted  nucleic acid-binding Zn-ribbon protein